MTLVAIYNIYWGILLQEVSMKYEKCAWLVKKNGGKMSMMRVVSDMKAKSILGYYKSDVL